MLMEFYKYEGAGNDFIIIDDRSHSFPQTDFQLVKQLCDRHFGIGGDGLMLLQLEEGHDFKMVYYNSDGNFSSMCGNGGRCIVQFAHVLGLIGNNCKFVAVDGPHKAKVISSGLISLQMIDVEFIEKINDTSVLMDTGSPHFVKMVDDLYQMDLISEGRKIRYNDRFNDEGVNVNFVQMINDELHIRTYERGVEDETLACGTGVTAAALAMAFWGNPNATIEIKAVGGDLNVVFEKYKSGFRNIWKTGPATFVFKGTIER
ncbi:diaminopimelate epimerase [Salibacteraceae bacterium]|nr:diaminopimelate epimerase [Salibacteraceae bacterium]MDC1304303.1 diaminopimelate epimerase [Salibacteraceae bacterium]